MSAGNIKSTFSSVHYSAIMQSESAAAHKIENAAPHRRPHPPALVDGPRVRHARGRRRPAGAVFRGRDERCFCVPRRVRPVVGRGGKRRVSGHVRSTRGARGDSDSCRRRRRGHFTDALSLRTDAASARNDHHPGRRGSTSFGGQIVCARRDACHVGGGARQFASLASSSGTQCRRWQGWRKCTDT